MSGFLQMLERQKKRERQQTFDLGNQTKIGQWLALEKCEQEATALCKAVALALPQKETLVRQSVSMESYRKPSSKAHIRVKTQVSALSRKTLQIKVHCHEVDPKGRFNKLSKAVYHYQRERK